VTLVGYARVSTSKQTLEVQKAALERAGCARIFMDVASGALAQRAQLAAAIDYMRAGDTLVVWKLDRLGRNASALLALLLQLRESGVEFRSLTENWDTGTPSGRAMLGMAAIFAEMERELAAERAREGREAARVNGRMGGRRSTVSPGKRARARTMIAQTDESLTEIARRLGVSREALYRAVPDAIRERGEVRRRGADSSTSSGSG